MLIATPAGGAVFWLILAALIALLVMHAIYWLVTHPVNKVWLKDQQMQGAGAAFFGMGGRGLPADDAQWTRLRDRWEYSHVARAVCATFSLVALITAAV